MPKFVLLWTDVSVWLLLLAFAVYAWWVRRSPGLSANWRKVFTDAAALSSALVLLFCLGITALDSLHFRSALPMAAGTKNTQVAYDTNTQSLMDSLFATVLKSRETTYSRPLAYLGFTKESVVIKGQVVRTAPRLKFGGAHLVDPAADWALDVTQRVLAGALAALAMTLALSALVLSRLARLWSVNFGEALRRVRARELAIPWHVAFWTVVAMGLLIGPTLALMNHYHVLGTDQTGNDVMYQALKSIRTAFVIGTLTTVATLPLAVGLGIMAGYFRSWADAIIQYVYTVLSSVPNILLIAACVLMVQVYLDKHPELFQTGAERGDLKLLMLCVILGLTGWAGLCRLLRGETMKLRELEYVQAASAFGVGHARIMRKHIFPNVAHLMLISTVLDFSGLILYEAVLSYVGVGVDPSMNSFGSMINMARSEMSRDPVVWWSFAAAFGFMVSLVLAANLFADGVRDAFDPRARVVRAKLVLKPVR